MLKVTCTLTPTYQSRGQTHQSFSQTNAPLVKLQAEIFTFWKINGSDLDTLISCSIFCMVYLSHIEQSTIQTIKLLWN